MSKFTTNQINEMVSLYSAIDRVDPCSSAYQKMVGMLDRLDNEALRQLASAKVKFVSMLAINRCIRRGLKV